MARETQEIIDTMDAEQALHPTLADLNSPSQTAIYTLWKYIVAMASRILEILWDKKKSEYEAILATGVTPSIYWLRQKAFEFQYDALTPQIVQLVNMQAVYVPIDITKRIITRAATNSSAGLATLFLAKNDPPEKLTAPELSSIQGYFTSAGDGTTQAVGVGFAGQSIYCVSLDPDLLYLEATIYYNGQYAGTIVNDTITAIEAYISDLGLYPIMKTVDLVDVIQSVKGFSDIDIVNLSCRDAATAWLSGTDLVLASATLATSYTTSSGYMIGETTATYTLLDKLTFTAV